MGYVAAAAAVATALSGIATTVNSMSQGTPKPKPTPAFKPVETTDMSKALLPGAKADAAARTGGGMSDQFLANLIGQESGQPGAGLDILGEIQRSLGQGGGIQAP